MSKNHNAVRLAYSKGYRVTDTGVVISPRGVPRALRNNQGYLLFTVGIGGGVSHPVSVHQLAAYQELGESAFADGMVVRHLDGNSLNNTRGNIAVGTHRDNIMDRPAAERRAHARAAGRARRSMPVQDVLDARQMFADGATLRQVMCKYGIAKSTASYIKNRRTYRDI